MSMPEKKTEKQTFSPEKFAKRMNELARLDIEMRHVYADKLMCQFLKKLGYEKGVEIFESWEKWHA